MKKVEIHSTQRVFDDFFKIDEAQLQYERFDGQMSPVVRRLNFERGDSVAAVLYNRQTDRVILVNQFKYPTLAKGPGWITETIAGMIDEGENPEDAIRREIKEETGDEVSRVEPIVTFYVSPGGTSERVMLYYAEIESGARHGPGGGLASEQEDIQRVELTTAEAFAQLDRGELVDAKTIIGIMWLRDRLQRRNDTT